ncbi:MAG: hypothetical protein AMXMBFR53_28480 [Gemmatimonadota bacterium]
MGFRASRPPAQGVCPGADSGLSGAVRFLPGSAPPTIPRGRLPLTGRGDVTGILEYLLANPILLAPLLLVVAAMVLAVLKKLLKIAAILAIAVALYVALVQYAGGP